jgi:hypothetical protein
VGSSARARPLINLEPNYEQIRDFITDKDVRTLLLDPVCTPIAGITYGANGIMAMAAERRKDTQSW